MPDPSPVSPETATAEPPDHSVYLQCGEIYCEHQTAAVPDPPSAPDEDAR